MVVVGYGGGGGRFFWLSKPGSCLWKNSSRGIEKETERNGVAERKKDNGRVDVDGNGNSGVRGLALYPTRLFLALFECWNPLQS